MPNNWQRWKGIMKCYPFEEKRLAKWHPPYIVQPKFDGVRCRVIRLDNGEVMLLSSEENVIFSVPHLNKILKQCPVPYELDGELYHHGWSFEEIVSITSRTINISPYHEAINFHCFDCVSDEPNAVRLKIISKLRDFHPNVKVSPFWLAESLDDIMKVYDKLINLGYEGIIVRHFEAPYVRKRSTLVMKFKPKKEDIYEIVGVQEEISKDGIPKGSLGALICASGDGTKFSVGTGFSRDAREELWSIRGILPGMRVRVGYQHITSGNKVPRFPVYAELVS